MGGGDQYAADRSRYAMQGESYLTETYTQSEGNVSRIYRLTRTSYEGTGKYGLKMVPEETVKAPERILVSFRIRASETLENIPVTFGYTDGSQSDYSDTLDADTQWEYRLAVFTVDYSKAVSAGIRNRSYGSTRSGVVAGDSRTQRRTSFGSRRLRSGRQGAYRQYQGHRRFRFRYAGRLRGLFQESLCFGERPHRRYADGCRRAGASEVPLRGSYPSEQLPEQALHPAFHTKYEAFPDGSPTGIGGLLSYLFGDIAFGSIGRSVGPRPSRAEVLLLLLGTDKFSSYPDRRPCPSAASQYRPDPTVAALPLFVLRRTRAGVEADLLLHQGQGFLFRSAPAGAGFPPHAVPTYGRGAARYRRVRGMVRPRRYRRYDPAPAVAARRRRLGPGGRRLFLSSTPTARDTSPRDVSAGRQIRLPFRTSRYAGKT